MAFSSLQPIHDPDKGEAQADPDEREEREFGVHRPSSSAMLNHTTVASS
jgi:hypothetical protein